MQSKAQAPRAREFLFHARRPGQLWWAVPERDLPATDMPLGRVQGAVAPTPPHEDNR